MPKVSPTTLLLIFAGGAIGTTARFLIELGIANIRLQPLFLTAIVNLLGAFLLGVVNNHPAFLDPKAKAFLGTGLLGGFTTMSGLALISGNPDYGLGPGGWGFWLFVVLQLAFGVLAYRFGHLAGSKRGIR